MLYGNGLCWTMEGIEQVPDRIRQRLEFLENPDLDPEWIESGGGSFSEVYCHRDYPSFILKLWNNEQFDCVMIGNATDDSQIMRRFGKDERIPVLYASCDRFVLMKRAPGELLCYAFHNGGYEEQRESIEGQVRDFIWDMLDKKIIPLDLHTSNIFFDQKAGKLTFIDFGLYTFMSDSDWGSYDKEDLFLMGYGEFLDSIQFTVEKAMAAAG